MSSKLPKSVRKDVLSEVANVLDGYVEEVSFSTAMTDEGYHLIVGARAIGPLTITIVGYPMPNKKVRSGKNEHRSE